MTYPIDTDNRTPHTEVLLEVAGEVNYTAIVKSGYHCACDIMKVNEKDF